jgi:hypothetical protein
LVWRWSHIPPTQTHKTIIPVSTEIEEKVN